MILFFPFLGFYPFWLLLYAQQVQNRCGDRNLPQFHVYEVRWVGVGIPANVPTGTLERMATPEFDECVYFPTIYVGLLQRLSNVPADGARIPFLVVIPETGGSYG